MGVQEVDAGSPDQAQTPPHPTEIKALTLGDQRGREGLLPKLAIKPTVLEQTDPGSVAVLLQVLDQTNKHFLSPTWA
jgi:hypothetical protein